MPESASEKAEQGKGDGECRGGGIAISNRVSEGLSEALSDALKEMRE